MSSVVLQRMNKITIIMTKVKKNVDRKYLAAIFYQFNMKHNQIKKSNKMITESNALQLAKRVFEHFTHDSLAIAREIIAMENNMEESPINGVPNSILEVTTTGVNDFPDTDPIGLNDPTQPVKQLNDELVYSAEDDFPF